MRIEELQLTAFGPFSDKILDFSQGREGLHLVYGPNEAGKSSALRALRHLFYGIPARTPDDFIHPYAKMRIGAVLRSEDGEVLKLIRRKGRDHTLRGPDDESIVDEAMLSRFLNGINEDLFVTMFGIGYEDLVRGGKEIIQGGGNLGRLIFSAGSGIANLQEIQNELQSAMDALYRPSAQKPVINERLLRFRSMQASLRDAQLPGQEWEAHQNTLQQALEQKAGVELKLASLQKKRSGMRRIQEALPIIARRKELIKDLEGMKSIPDLAEDFPERRRELITELSVAEREKAQAAAAIKSNEQAIAALAVSSLLMEHADGVEELYQELGSHRKAARDSINLETLRDTLRGEAGEILRMLKEGITIDEAEQLRIKKDQVVQIQELSGQYERITARIEDIQARLPELKHTAGRIDDELERLPAPLPTKELQTALSEAEAFGPLEAGNRRELDDIRAMEISLEKERHRIGLGDKSVESVECLSVPGEESIRVFEDRFSAIMQSIKDIERDVFQARERMQENEKQLESNRLEQGVPTEEDLTRIRQARDRGLAMIARRLDRKEVAKEALDAYLKESPQAATLIDAFTSHIRQADGIADRLRREADRVAANARLISDQQACRTKMEQLREMMDVCDQRKRSLIEAWQQLWREADIDPRSPKEMMQWLQSFNAMVQKMTEARTRRSRADGLSLDIETHRTRLMRSLRRLAGDSIPEDATLGRLIALGGEVLEEQSLLMHRRNELIRDKLRLEKELKDTDSRLAAGETNLTQWQGKWEQAVRPIGLMADAMPAQAAAVLEDLKILFDKLREADILQRRIQGIRRDEASFADRVGRLVEKVAADLKSRTVDETVLELHQRLRKVRDADSQRRTLENQTEKEHRRHSAAREKTAFLQAELMRMCREADCEDPEVLPEVEKLSIRRRRMETELKHAEDRLRQVSGGVTIEEFVSQAMAADPDALDSDIHRLEEDIEGLSHEKSDLDQVIGRERNELDKMDGSAKAAVLAEEMQFLSGGIAGAVEKYARLRIAAKILGMAMDRYRDKSQGPILERASRLFEQLTLGSFNTLRAEYDSGGQPVLVGVRSATHEIVGVEGMSDGTADQLYLALRLAGLEIYLERNEAIPLVVDDILISFDDRRAAAALQILSGQSERNQIIFFTHHRHLVELAESHVEPSKLFRHHLDPL